MFVSRLPRLLALICTGVGMSVVGLIIPNIVAIFKGDKIRGSLLDVALFGAAYVILCDIIGRLVITPFELPIDLISGIIGSIIFLALMFKKLSYKKAPKEVKTIA